jgi:hypothetical protein
MDPRHFDTLTRSLTGASSRRGALAALLGGTLGVLGLVATDGKKKKGKGKNKKKRKRKKNQAPPLPTPTCSDGIKNGNESDVDCGGSCGRCANGKICISRADCTGALCIGETCQECSPSYPCGSDVNGPCSCLQPVTGGPMVCRTAAFTGGIVTSCTACPPGTVCREFPAPGQFVCYTLCDAP